MKNFDLYRCPVCHETKIKTERGLECPACGHPHIINLDDMRPHMVHTVICPTCKHRWTAGYPCGTKELECPSCHRMDNLSFLIANELIYQVEKTLSWTLDLLDMYDERLAIIDGPEKVYSMEHLNGKAHARWILERTKNILSQLKE